jgi:hypothetical protein
MKKVLLLLLFVLSFLSLFSQSIRTLVAKRATTSIKIDGKLDDEAWKEAPMATGFTEMRPNFGAPVDPAVRTEVYILYDNEAIYFAGHCYERSKDSVSKELLARDNEGANDWMGVIFDTYYDKINGLGFYITPYGSQMDAKYSTTNGEDFSWNAVWESETQLVTDGWTFEVKIPYSALRFVSRDKQTWGINFLRGRKKAGRDYCWSPVDPKVSGFVNQEGTWTDIEKIEAPVRLSFSPYFSAYLNHYPVTGAKDWTSSINGGMDVKYGVSDAFTLDMTLIPDFGQVRSDNQVLNLSPFETRFGENRPFFIEGTELFNKGNLFYSRRVGSRPVNFGDAYTNLGPNEYVFKNPIESKLINATKLSGRTKKGLGLGLFNGLAKPMYATIKDSVDGTKRTVKTGVLTNYNIAVVDQTLKNHSSISFINLNTIRDDHERDANVSAALFDINNKKNTYNWSGKVAVSNVMDTGKTSTGYSHNWSFNKTGGRWNFILGEELINKNYDINDLGILFTRNYVDHFFWSGYRWLKPTKWYNRIQVNYNAYYSRVLTRFPNQVIQSMYQSFSTNVNANLQTKKLWFLGFFFGYVPKGNDFYEPRVEGRSFRTPRRIQINPWFNTNFSKKYYVEGNYFVGLRSLFNSPNHEINIFHRYRFSDKLSVSHNLNYNPTINDAGFYDISGTDIIFSKRDLKTVENIINIKFNFNKKSGINFRARYYWSRVHVKELYDLQPDGSLTYSVYNGTLALENQNFNIFNIDAGYTLEFAPGSFINIVWKDEAFFFDQDFRRSYFKNFDRTLGEPQNNNLSIKIIYYLDYLKIRNWRRKS